MFGSHKEKLESLAIHQDIDLHHFCDPRHVNTTSFSQWCESRNVYSELKDVMP